MKEDQLQMGLQIKVQCGREINIYTNSNILQEVKLQFLLGWGFFGGTIKFWVKYFLMKRTTCQFHV
jgi:hypothetical protein